MIHIFEKDSSQFSSNQFFAKMFLFSTVVEKVFIRKMTQLSEIGDFGT